MMEVRVFFLNSYKSPGRQTLSNACDTFKNTDEVYCFFSCELKMASAGLHI